MIPFNIPGFSKIVYNLKYVSIFKILKLHKICYLQRNISSDFANKKASIIIPCKNEENNISKLVNDPTT